MGQSSTGPSLPTQETTLAGNTPNEMMNDANPRVDASAAMEDVSPSVVVVDEVVAKEKIGPLVDIRGSYPPLPTQATSSAGNALGHGQVTRSVEFHRSMDGLDAMLENGPWFIWNNPFIMKKWHPDENLLKEDVSTISFWAKLHGVPITAFSDNGLSAIATKLGTLLMLDSYTSDILIVPDRVEFHGK
ncbi:ribonuclease H-like domain-containing protein [Tanacetum coccineum]